MSTKQMWAFKDKKTGKLSGETKKELPLLYATRKEAKMLVLPGEQIVKMKVTVEEM